MNWITNIFGSSFDPNNLNVDPDQGYNSELSEINSGNHLNTLQLLDTFNPSSLSPQTGFRTQDGSQGNIVPNKFPITSRDEKNQKIKIKKKIEEEIENADNIIPGVNFIFNTLFRYNSYKNIAFLFDVILEEPLDIIKLGKVYYNILQNFNHSNTPNGTNSDDNIRDMIIYTYDYISNFYFNSCSMLLQVLGNGEANVNNETVNLNDDVILWSYPHRAFQRMFDIKPENFNNEFKINECYDNLDLNLLGVCNNEIKDIKQIMKKKFSTKNEFINDDKFKLANKIENMLFDYILLERDMRNEWNIFKDNYMLLPCVSWFFENIKTVEFEQTQETNFDINDLDKQINKSMKNATKNAIDEINENKTTTNNAIDENANEEIKNTEKIVENYTNILENIKNDENISETDKQQQIAQINQKIEELTQNLNSDVDGYILELTQKNSNLEIEISKLENEIKLEKANKSNQQDLDLTKLKLQNLKILEKQKKKNDENLKILENQKMKYEKKFDNLNNEYIIKFNNADTQNEKLKKEIEFLQNQLNDYANAEKEKIEKERKRKLQEAEEKAEKKRRKERLKKIIEALKKSKVKKKTPDPPDPTVVKKMIDLNKSIAEQKAEIQDYYHKIACTLNNISISGESLNELNRVFQKTTEKNWDYEKCGTESSRFEVYTNEATRLAFNDCLDKVITDNINDIKRIHAIYKYVSSTMKNDFELLRGPVRVYLKLKKMLDFQGEVPKNVLINKADNDYEIHFTPFCNNLISESANKEISQMVDPIKEKENDIRFSRVFDGQDNVGAGDEPASVIFQDSVKDTIENMIGVSDTIIMAYGPSGSGKTHNLVGVKSDPGIIKLALKYMVENKDKLGITKLEMSSKQYYSYCGKPKSNDKFKVLEFDSLFMLNDSLNNAIKDNTSVANYTDTFNKKMTADNFIYKFKQYQQAKDPIKRDLPEQITYTNFQEWIFDLGISGKTPEDKKKMRKHIDDLYNNKDGIEYFPKIDLDSFKDTKYSEETFGNFYKWFINNDINDKTLLENPNFERSWAAKAGKSKTISDSNPPPGVYFNGFNKFLIQKDFEFTDVKDVIVKDAYNKRNEDSVSDEIKGFIHDKFTVLTKTTQSLPYTNFLKHNAYYKVMQNILNFGDLFGTEYSFLKNVSNKEEKISIDDLSNVQNVQNVFDKLYYTVEHSRPTRSTPLNPDSSRSHLIITIYIHSENAPKPSKLVFVDLAGNEKADQNLFQMRYEGNGITGSLLAIKDVLRVKQDPRYALSANWVDDYRNFFAIGGIGAKPCQNLYNAFKKAFEDVIANDKATGKETTVSMYLNLPRFMFDSNDSETNANRCDAIADSLYFVNQLLKGTAIAQYIYKPEDKCDDRNFTLGKTSFGAKMTVRKIKARYAKYRKNEAKNYKKELRKAKTKTAKVKVKKAYQARLKRFKTNERAALNRLKKPKSKRGKGRKKSGVSKKTKLITPDAATRKKYISYIKSGYRKEHKNLNKMNTKLKKKLKGDPKKLAKLKKDYARILKNLKKSEKDQLKKARKGKIRILVE